MNRIDVPKCKRSSYLLNEILPYLFDYARRKRLVNAPFRALDQLQKEGEAFPDEWEDNIRGMLAANAVCGSTKAAAAFVRSMGNEIADSQLQLARVWRWVPWIFCAFRVTEDHGNDVVSIDPIGDPPPQWPKDLAWQDLPLYSESVANAFRHGTRVFLTQIWYSGHAFFTYGVVVLLPSMTEEDLFFFADVARYSRQGSSRREPLVGLPGRTTGLSALMGRDPLPFLRLLHMAGAPPVASREGEMRALRAWAPLNDSAPVTEEELVEAVQNAGEPVYTSAFGPGAGALFFGQGSPMYDPEAYIAFNDRRLFLHAFSAQSYERGRRAVAAIAPIPEQAQVDASFTVYIAATDIFGINDQISALQDRFDDVRGNAEPVPADAEQESGPAPTMEELQAVLNRVMTNHNEGIQETTAEIARDLGIDEEVVASLAAKLGETVEGMDRRTPGADRLGLAPRPFAELSRTGVPRSRGALVLRSDAQMRESAAAQPAAMDLLERAEPMRFATWLLSKAVADGFVPATGAGYVSTHVVREALAERIIPSPLEQARQEVDDAKLLAALEDSLRPKKEADWGSFHAWRRLLERARLLQHDGKRFRPTDDAAELLAAPVELYHRLLVTMFEKGEWDWHRHLGAIPSIREMAGFLFYAARTLASDDEWVSVDKLVDAFIGAVPRWSNAIRADRGQEDTDAVISPRLIATIGVVNLFLADFAEPFNLVEVRIDPDGADDDPTWQQRPRSFRTTTLFPVVFRQ